MVLEEVENRLSFWPPAIDMSLHDDLQRLPPIRVPSRARIFSDDDDDDLPDDNDDHDHDHQDFEESRSSNASADFFDVVDFSFVWSDDDSSYDDFVNYLYEQEVDRRTNRTDGLSEETISHFLKSRTRRRQPGGEDDDLEESICVICQCEYKEIEEEEILVADLECGHEYHESCIHTWLTLNNSCPLCKREAIQQL